MKKRTIINGFPVHTIYSQDGATQASFIPTRGGMCSSIKMPGKAAVRELLYQEDNFWQAPADELVGAWPFCFPICGRLERQERIGHYYYDGQLYQLPIHGFAWQEPWEVQHKREDYLILSLCDNARTLASYPFKFYLELHYYIQDRLLLCQQTYSNRGDHPMPYYAGFHPYFLTPAAEAGKSQVTLTFQPQRRFQYNQQLTDLVGLQDLFALPTSISNSEINEQLTELGTDKTIRLDFPDGDIIYLNTEGIEDKNLFPFLQIYTPPNKSFICLEPWMGYPNAMNSVSGVRWLNPGESEHGLLRLSLNEGGGRT